MKEKLLLLFLICISCAMFLLSGCTDASKASRQISNKADKFQVYRTIKVFNCRTDKVLLEFSGWCSINVDKDDNQLEITYRTGEDEYAKDFIGLNEYITYTISQEESSQIDKFHYEWRWDSWSTH